MHQFRFGDLAKDYFNPKHRSHFDLCLPIVFALILINFETEKHCNYNPQNFDASRFLAENNAEKKTRAEKYAALRVFG